MVRDFLPLPPPAGCAERRGVMRLEPRLASPPFASRRLALLSALLAAAAAEPEKVACQSGLRGDFTFKTCADFCKPTRASNHCRFCKCQQCPFCTAVKSGVAVDGGAAAPAAAALDQPASVEAASRRLPPSNRRPRAGPPPPLSGPTVAASQPDGGGGGGDGGWSAMGLVVLIVLAVGGAIAAAVGYRALSNPGRKPCALF